MSPPNNVPEKKTILHKANSLLGTLIFRLLTVVLLAALAAFVYLLKVDGERILASEIDKSPILAAASKAADLAATTAQTAQKTAEVASGKADQMIASQARLFTVITDIRNGQASFQQTYLERTAKLEATVDGHGKQLDRMEARMNGVK